MIYKNVQVSNIINKVIMALSNGPNDMNLVCGICNELSTFPIKLQCNHTYCYLCIKTFKLDGNLLCPSCGEFFDVNFNLFLDDIDAQYHSQDTYLVRWLYSSNYKDHWWCYDNKTSDLIIHRSSKT